MGKTEAIVLMACDAKVAAQSAVAYAKQGSQPRATLKAVRLPGSCAPLTACTAHARSRLPASPGHACGAGGGPFANARR
jgi:hypothetical protein